MRDARRRWPEIEDDVRWDPTGHCVHPRGNPVASLHSTEADELERDIERAERIVVVRHRESETARDIMCTLVENFALAHSKERCIFALASAGREHRTRSSSTGRR